MSASGEHRYRSCFVGGEWVPPLTGGVISVENPATEEIIAEVPQAAGPDVDRAVSAARASLPDWSALSRIERADHLAALLTELTAHREQMQQTITSEMGAPASMAARLQVGLPLRVLASFVDILRSDIEPSRVANSMIVEEPVGVVGAITPWNYPLHQAMAKIAAALAAGCTVVHKPSELTPLSAYLLAEIVEKAGLPAGAYNLVTGYGPVAGSALAAHPGVDMVSFTGSTVTGSRVAALAAETVKRVSLELGGKSANVVLEDADFAAAIKVGVANCLLNTGQSCNAWTRLLVPRQRLDEAVDAAVVAAAKYVPGDPSDPTTRLGPLVSAVQRDRVAGYVTCGLEQGCRLVADGRAGLPDRGYFFGPTIFAGVDPDATIAQEEIFGPVLSVIGYADEPEALRIANGTRYGLAASVWSADPDRALRIAGQLRAGQVDINGAAFNHLAPFGGVKGSGYGREFGRHGIAEFSVVKAIQLPEPPTNPSSI